MTDERDDGQPSTRRRWIIGAAGAAVVGGIAAAVGLRGRKSRQDRGPGSLAGQKMTSPGARPRRVRATHRGQELLEGAGVRLRRFIGSAALDYVDPFLLLDEFKSDDPGDYIAGFPWHPHRGIETVTYMLSGQVKHGDSIGNSGVIGPGDVQWMTAGHGIIHEEMPRQREGRLWGFQLWVNLPAKLKLCDPRYQELGSAAIPEVVASGGGAARVVAGQHAGRAGPVTDIAAQPLYLDVRLPAFSTFEQKIPSGHNAFCYVYQGRGQIGGTSDDPGPTLDGQTLALLDDGDHLWASASDEEVRFLLAAGRPLNEPVARGGPFVMNTPAEIEQAYRDYRNGTLLKKR